MATTRTTTRTTRRSSRGIGARLTAKVGPLPVWAWALGLLIVGYLVYRFSGAGSSSNTTSSTDSSTTAFDAGTNDGATTPAGAGDTGSPPASGQGGAADNLSGDLFGQLTGLQGSVDSLTALVQATPAFYDPSNAGAGSDVPLNGQPQQPASTASSSTTKAPAKPTATTSAPAHIRYFTYAPGKAPKSRKGDEAPARGPAGTTLHFARGKGYYYA